MLLSSCTSRANKITGIVEYDGGLHNKNGIDINALIEFRAKNGTVQWIPWSRESCFGGLAHHRMRDPDFRRD